MTQVGEIVGRETKPRNRPYVTIVLILLCYGFFYFAPNDLLFWLSKDDMGKIVTLLIHPIIHESTEHLISNTLLAFIGGTMVETWMIVLSRKFRYGIFLFAYAVSLAVSYWAWSLRSIGPAVGLSGVISAIVPFTVLYYLEFSDRIDLIGPSVFAPVGVGFLSYFLVQPFIPGARGYFTLNETALLHCFAAFPSLVVASLLLDRVRRKEPRQ